jgi:hypothetical protein
VRIIKGNLSFIFLLFFTAFIVRSCVFYFYLSKNDNHWQVDSNTYHEIAVQIVQGNGVSTSENTKNFYRLPGYPFFLSIYYKLFGVDRKNVLWMQIFLASFIPVLIFFLCLVLLSKNLFIAKMVSLYSVLHLGLVLYSGFFMTESLFIFFLLLFFIFFFYERHLFFCSVKNIVKKTSGLVKKKRNSFAFHAINCYPFSSCMNEVQEINLDSNENIELEQKRNRFLLYAGFFLGIASLIRPVGHYFVVVPTILLLLFRGSFSKKIGNCLILNIAWLVPVSFWLIRNYLLLGYLFFHTLPGGHFLYLSAARTVMYAHDVSYEKARNFLSKEAFKKVKGEQKKLGKKLSEIEICNVYENIAKKYFKKYPFITAKNWLTDMMRTSLSLYSAELLYIESEKKEVDYFNKKRTIPDFFKKYLFPHVKSMWLKILIYAEIFLFFLVLLGFLGFLLLSIMKFITKRKVQWMCLMIRILPCILFFVVISLSGGYARMRLPIEYLLFIPSFLFYDKIFSLKSYVGAG